MGPFPNSKTLINIFLVVGQFSCNWTKFFSLCIFSCHPLSHANNRVMVNIDVKKKNSSASVLRNQQAGEQMIKTVAPHVMRNYNFSNEQ